MFWPIKKNHRCRRLCIFTLKSDLFRFLSANLRASPFREKHAQNHKTSHLFNLKRTVFRKLHPDGASSPSGSVSRYPCTLRAPVIHTLHPELYHPHSSDSSSADWREKSQPCSNSHAAGAANANRDIGSWMQAWSQWLFCSWHGLCLIGIGHAEWSSGEGYGNAPTESIKWGDTLRPYDGQRINESHRKESRD